MKKEIKIGNKIIGKCHPTYIIAEIGSNHNRDKKIAKELRILKFIKNWLKSIARGNNKELKRFFEKVHPAYSRTTKLTTKDVFVK